MAGADIDAEVIMLSARLWKQLGILDAVTLQLNSLGSNEARAVFRADLVTYLEAHKDELDEDSRRRLDSNPLRILDSKDAGTQALLDKAPVLNDYLDEDSKSHFAELCESLDAAGIKYEINPRLVRGLDYYCKTVFEWVTDKLGAQGTVCAGGRYDGLVQQLGGRATPGVGFAMGVERLILLLETLNVVPDALRQPFDVYLAAEHKGIQPRMVVLADKLRDAVPGLRIQLHCSGLKNIANKARQTGAAWVILVRQNEEGSLVSNLWYNSEPSYDVAESDIAALLQQQQA